MLARLINRYRRVYFFGYGADRDPDLLKALTGRKPKVLGSAVLDGFELRIQTLDEVTQAGANPQRILQKAWGESFKSYVIVPKEGASVAGTLFKIRLRDRHLVDKWEMVSEGWYDKVFVEVRLRKSGKVYHAETQQLRPGQHAAANANGLNYVSWLQPKHQVLHVAARVARVMQQ